MVGVRYSKSPLGQVLAILRRAVQKVEAADQFEEAIGLLPKCGASFYSLLLQLAGEQLCAQGTIRRCAGSVEQNSVAVVGLLQSHSEEDISDLCCREVEHVLQVLVKTLPVSMEAAVFGAEEPIVAV